MSPKGVGHKVNRQLLRIAKLNGARIVQGKKHIKIYNGDELVAVLSYGGHRRDRVPQGMATEVLKKMKAIGWNIHA